MIMPAWRRRAKRFFLWTYATIAWKRQEPEGSCTGVGLVNFFAIVCTLLAIKLMFDKMGF